MTSITLAAIDCECDSSWKINNNRTDICVLCSLNRLTDRNQPNYNKKYILTHVYSRLKYGSETRLSRNIFEANHFDTIFELIFNSNCDVSEMAANVVLVLTSQLGDKALNLFIFNQTILKTIKLPQISCTTLAFISGLIHISDGSVDHILDKECELIRYLSVSYWKSQEFAVQLPIMQIFAQIYKSCELNDLFWFDQHFHQNTIEMCFKAFNSGADDLILICLELLNNVRYNHEIISIILNTSELYVCLNALISGYNNDIVIALSKWICKLIESSDEHNFANNIIIRGIVDKIFNALSSSHDRNLSLYLLRTIDLIVNRSTHFRTVHHSSYIVDGFNKAITLALNENDDNLCGMALCSYAYLLQNYDQLDLMNEYHYKNTFQLIEKVLLKYSLYSDAVNLSMHLYKFYRIPIHFPADTLFGFLMKVISFNKEIDNFVVHTEAKLNSENVVRFNAVIKLMNTTLTVIKEFYGNKNDCQRPVLERFGGLENSANFEIIDAYNDINTNAINELDSFNAHTCQFESIIEFCIRNFEKIFDYTIQIFVYYYGFDISFIVEHITIISNLCEFLSLIFGEQLNILNIDHCLKPLSERILKNGIVSFLWQMINFHYIYWSNYLEIKSFRQNISKVLSVIVAFVECKNETSVIGLNCVELMKGFEAINVNSNSICEVIRDWIKCGNGNNYSQFCFSLFAISYYCLLYDRNYEMDVQLQNIITVAIQTKVSDQWKDCTRITIKHILFLIAALDCEQQMQKRISYVPDLFQYLSDRSEHCLTQIYTNEIRMIKWSFDSAPNRSFFGHFALKTFLTCAPIHQNDVMFLFVSFMAESDDAMQTLMDVIFKNNECFTLVSNIVISNGDNFIVSAEIFAKWQQFCINVFKKLYDAVCNIANTWKQLNDNQLYGTEFSNLIEFLCTFRAHMFSRNNSLDVKYDLSQSDDSLHILNHNLCHFMDSDSSESVASAIFWHLRQCFHSFNDYNSIRLANTILRSYFPFFVAVKYATKDFGETNWSNRENIKKLKEMSVYLLAILTKYKSEECRINYSISFESNTIIDWLLNDSFDINKSAILLLSKCFDGNQFFNVGNGDRYRSSIETSVNAHNPITKIVRVNPELQMRKLVLCLVNAISKTTEKLEDCDAVNCLSKILDYLLHHREELFRHITNHPWYQLLKNY